MHKIQIIHKPNMVPGLSAWLEDSLLEACCTAWLLLIGGQIRLKKAFLHIKDTFHKAIRYVRPLKSAHLNKVD